VSRKWLAGLTVLRQQKLPVFFSISSTHDTVKTFLFWQYGAAGAHGGTIRRLNHNQQ